MPSSGVVSVKNIDIRDLTDVQISGTARDMASFNAMRDKLGNVQGVANLHAETSGTPPQIKYTLAYQWQPTAGELSNGN